MLEVIRTERTSKGEQYDEKENRNKRLLVPTMAGAVGLEPTALGFGGHVKY